MLELKEPCIQDQQWVNALLEQANQKQTLFSCDLPFGSTFIWRGMYHIRIGRYKQFYLRAYGNEPGKIRFAYPIGDGDIQEVLAQMLLYAKQVHKELALVGLTAQQTQQVEALYPGEFVFASNRAYAEYIYYSQDLAELKGRKYHGKRSHICRFKNMYAYTFEPITEANKEDALHVAKQWCSENVLGRDNGLSHEVCAIREAFKYYDTLGFRGALIRVDGIPVAMTAGEPLNDEVFVVHFEKALSGYEGLYAAINHFFAQTLTKYKYINREEDLGIEGLRRAKLSYRPCILLEEYEGVLERDKIYAACGRANGAVQGAV